MVAVGNRYLDEVSWMEIGQARKDEDFAAIENERDVEWICVKCWLRYRNDFSLIPGG